MTNKERYRKVFDKVAASGMERVEVNTVKKHNKRWHSFPRAAAAALAAFASAGGIAYAAIRYYGILDFTKGTSFEVQSEAASLIESDLTQEKEAVKVILDTNTSEDEKGLVHEVSIHNDLFECDVKEALRDSETITIVCEVSAKEKGKYLFVPEDAMPEDGVPETHGSQWDFSGDTSIREYARQNNLTIVNIGGSIENSDELGIIGQTIDFLSPADDIIDIYVRGAQQTAGDEQNVTCVATARPESDNVIVKERVTFSLENRSEANVSLYAPSADTAYSEDLNCTFTKAEVIQTELGTYVELYFAKQDGTLWEGEYALEIPDFRDKQTGGFTVASNEEGVYKTRIDFSKIELGESFTVMAYDIENDKELSAVTFVLQQQ